jgi:hypothetical protein
MPAIKLAGGSTGTRKSSKSKPKAKAKPAAKRSPGRPRSKSAEAPAKQTRQPSSNGRTRRPVTDDERVIKRHIKALTKAGDLRRDAEEAHKEAVEAMFEATRAAMDDGVPTGTIIEYAGITRQWLYNMGKHRNRDNGGAKVSKRGAGKSAAKSTGKRTRNAPESGSKTKRPRIRSIG